MALKVRLDPFVAHKLRIRTAEPADLALYGVLPAFDIFIAALFLKPLLDLALRFGTFNYIQPVARRAAPGSG